MALFVESLKGINSKAIASTITAVSTVWSMFELHFPQAPSYKLLLKGLDRQQPIAIGRGALCPHDWLPNSMDSLQADRMDMFVLERFTAIAVC